MSRDDDNNSNPDVPENLARTENAKAIGGGLDAGTTDFGPRTAPAQGGRTGAGSDSGRSYTGSPNERSTRGDPEDPPPNSGAAGNAVLNTGRPMRGDERGAIGEVAHPDEPSPETDPREQDSGFFVPVGQTRSAAGSSIGNRGGGAAGSGAVTNDRSVDITEGRVGGPEGNLANPLVPPKKRT
jgi:hypothetical protein